MRESAAGVGRPLYLRVALPTHWLMGRQEVPMTARPLALLVPAVLLAAACGTGRLVPSDTAAPADEPPAARPVAAPPPESPAPAPATAPAPAPAPTTSGYAPYGAVELDIRRVGQFTQTTLGTPERLVIRDNDSWTRFWASVSGGSPPSVDFSRDLVIAVAAGQRTNGGHSIAVERVVRAGAGLSIQVVETVPGPGCVTSQAVIQPVDVVVVAAADAKTWGFSERTDTQPCS